MDGSNENNPNLNPEPTAAPAVETAPGQTAAPAPEAAPEPAPAKKKFLNGKWYIPAAIVAAVAAVGLNFNTIVAAVSPKTELKWAAERTQKAVEAMMERSPYGEIAGALKDMKDALGVDVDFRYEGEYGDRYDGSAELALDMDSELFRLGGELHYENDYDDDTDLSADVVLRRDDIAFTTGGLGKYYGVTFDTFRSDLKKSALGEWLDEDDIDEAADAVEEAAKMWRDALDQRKDGKKAEDLAAPYQKLADDFVKELKFKNKTRKTEVGGEKTECICLTATIKSEELQDFLTELLETAEDDDDLFDLFKSVYAVSGEGDDAKSEWRSAFREAKSQVKTELRGMDTDLSYYIYKGKLVKLEITAERADGDTVGLVVDYGREPGKDDIAGELSYQDGGYTEKYSVSYAVKEKKAYTETLTLTRATGHGDDLAEEQVIVTTKWTKDTGKVNTEVRYVDDYSEESYDLDWTMKRDKDTLTLSVEELKLSEYSDDKLTLTVAVTGAPEIREPDSFVNLDKLSEDDLEEIEETLSGVFGGNAYAYDDYDDWYDDGWDGYDGWDDDGYDDGYDNGDGYASTGFCVACRPGSDLVGYINYVFFDDWMYRGEIGSICDQYDMGGYCYVVAPEYPEWSYGADYEAVAARGTLYVGIETDWYPYEYVDENGYYSGIDVEIAALIARHMDVNVEYVVIDDYDYVGALASGKVDIVLGYGSDFEGDASLTTPYIWP